MLGWSLVPIVPETKIPAVQWKEFQDRRPKIDEIEHWLKKGWHLAVVTGDISGVLIVDDDRIKHGLKEWGFISPVTAVSKSGGKHYYFTYDRELHSHSNSQIRVDLKAWHSYCLLPPFNGRKWISPPTMANMKKLVPLTDDIVRLINSDTHEQTGERKKIIMGDFLTVPEGGRTDALHKIACSIFTKYPKEEGIQILLGINQTYDPPVTEEEFKYQVGRAYSFVASKKEGLETPHNLSELIEVRKDERLLENDCPKTGLNRLDFMVKGFVPKHTYTLTGSTNVGKTSLACVFAVNVAKQGRKVLYLALEPDTGVVEYIASILADKPFSELNPDVDYNFGDLPISVFTKQQIRTPQKLLEVLDKSERYDLVIIDHIGYFVKDVQNTVGDQANVLKILTEIATTKRCSMLIIAHLRKPTVVKKGVIPTMDDISGSSAFKQDSTDVWIVYRYPVDGDETHTMFTNKGLLIVGKSKNSASGTIPIEFGDRKAGIKEESFRQESLPIDQDEDVEKVSLFGEELFK